MKKQEGTKLIPGLPEVLLDGELLPVPLLLQVHFEVEVSQGGLHAVLRFRELRQDLKSQSC